jgi:hypothetical protein
MREVIEHIEQLVDRCREEADKSLQRGLVRRTRVCSASNRIGTRRTCTLT